MDHASLLSAVRTDALVGKSSRVGCDDGVISRDRSGHEFEINIMERRECSLVTAPPLTDVK